MSTVPKKTNQDTTQLESHLQSKLSTAVDLARVIGIRKFVGEILPWHFARRYIFYSMELASKGKTSHRTDLSTKRAVPLDFRLELAGEADLEHIMTVRPHYYVEEQLIKRLQAGHLCFIGWIKDEPVHLRWHFVHSLYLPYLRRTLRLAPHEIWADEAYTKPALRRSGIFAHAGNLITQSLAEMNFQRLSCAFASWNITPQHISLERGMKPVGEVIHHNYFGHHTFSCSGQVKEGEDNIIEIEEIILQDTDQQQ